MPNRDLQFEQQVFDALVNILSDRAKLSAALAELHFLPQPVPVVPGTKVDVNVYPTPPPCPCIPPVLKFHLEAEILILRLEQEKAIPRDQVIHDLLVNALTDQLRAYASTKGLNV
jgi:hypothetical protein